MAAASRTSAVYSVLKEDLLNGLYRPGSKLQIDQIAARFGISLGAVREALSRLTSDRLVAAEPQRGFTVAPISRQDLADLTAVRIDIEIRCLERSIRLGDLEWEGRLISTWHQMVNTPVSDPSTPGIPNPEWTRLHSQFHDDLIAACDSIWWLRLRESLFTQAERYRRMMPEHARATRNVEAEHKTILDAALARDIDGASKALAAHLSCTTEILLDTTAWTDENLRPGRGSRIKGAADAG